MVIGSVMRPVVEPVIPVTGLLDKVGTSSVPLVPRSMPHPVGQSMMYVPAESMVMVPVPDVMAGPVGLAMTLAGTSVEINNTNDAILLRACMTCSSD